MTLPPEDLAHVLAHTRKAWIDLKGSRLFVTGGTGFFGCWLMESFAAANDSFHLGARAVVLTRDPDQFARKAPRLAAHPAITLLRGDVAGFAFPAGEFSHVVHAAATFNAPVSDEEVKRTIVRGTERVLEFAETARARRLLLTSSGAVYGKQPPELTHLPESFVPSAEAALVYGAYGEGKRVAEQLCIDACRPGGLEATIARCFAFVGPYLPLDGHFAIGNFIRDGLAGAPIRIQGDGSPFRSYLYAADLAIWLWTILFRGAPARTYNVGSPQSITIRELAETTGSIFGIPVSIARKPKPDELPSRYVPDTQRARSELGLEAWVPLEEAIRKTARWNAKHFPGMASVSSL